MFDELNPPTSTVFKVTTSTLNYVKLVVHCYYP